MGKNKFTYITVFSGLGGSALGLQQAGGEGLLALDFEKNSIDHLKANFPELAKKGCILHKDIRKVSGQEIMELTGLKPGSLGLYTSSAPCQGFSSSNTKRDADDLRNDLFFESIKHVQILQPKIFIFENVAGMVRGNMRGKYLQIISALREPPYNVKTWVLKASDYGAPQTRPRTWIIGVRNDLGIEPSVPPVHSKVVSVTDVLPHLQGIQQGQFSRDIIPGNCACPTITKTAGFRVFENGIPRKPTIEELRVLCTFPEDYKFVGSQSQIHERLGNSVLPLQMKVLADHLYQTVLSKPIPQKVEVNVESLPNSASDLDEYSKELQVA